MQNSPSRNLGLDLLRVTEAAAVAAGRWIGLGDPEGAHHDATRSMSTALSSVEMNGEIVIGEESRLSEHSPLDSGEMVGTSFLPAPDKIGPRKQWIAHVLQPNRYLTRFPVVSTQPSQHLACHLR